MGPDAPIGFTLWLRATASDNLISETVEEIALELSRRGLPVEPVDAARLAKEAYVSKSASKGVSLAIAMTADALNRHGVVCLIHGARSSAGDFAWKKRKPERLLDIVCAGEDETVLGSGPYLTLHPLTHDSASPEPPSVARVDVNDNPTEEEPSGIEDPELIPEAVPKREPLRQNLSPLFEALEKAGWIPAASTPTNGDDEVLRKRLKNLGYL
jgi:hypothetical protein